MASGKYIRSYRHNAIKAARELLYGEDIIVRLKQATTETEICRIMKTARCR